MVITWIIFLLATMVHVKDAAKPKKAKRTKRAKNDSDTESETDSIDWDNLEIEGGVPIVSKGKAPADTSKPPPTAAEKGKAPMDPNPVGSKRKTVARKRGRAQGIEINEPCQEQTKNIPQIDTESEDEEDWDTFLNEVQQGIDKENKLYLKNKKLMKSSTTTNQYTKKKNSPSNGIQIDEPIDNSHSLPRRSPRNEGQTASSAVTQRSSISRRIDKKPNLVSSINQEQDKLALELRKMSTDIHKMKQECSTISGMLKGILKKLGCTSSEDSESDD